MEFIWTQTVEYVAGTAPYDKYEMQANVFAAFHELEFHKSACSHVYMALNWIGLTNGLAFFKNQYFAHKQLEQGQNADDLFTYLFAKQQAFALA